MVDNASKLLTSGNLQGTVVALRALRSNISRTITQLEKELPREEPPAPVVEVPAHPSSGYTLFGQTFKAEDGTRILVEVLRHFAELDAKFPEYYSAVVRRLGRRRPYVARTRQALYPGKPDLLSQTAEFAPGWFVGTNEGNDKKLRLLHVACDVLGLRWNQDLRVRMP